MPRIYKSLLRVCKSRPQLLFESRQIKTELKLKNKPKEKYFQYLKQRCLHKPLAYILQNQPFLDLEILVRKPVLIPRWETEEWTDRLISSLTNEKTAIELCSGSGCVSLAIAHHNKEIQIDALDWSKPAFKLARLNQRRLGIDSKRLKFHLIDIFSKDLESFTGYDIVICNPPYIRSDELDSLDKSVKDWEDLNALDGGEDGLRFYKHIADCKFLFKNGSRFIFEIGETQGHSVSQIMKDAGFVNVKVELDLAGKDRVVTGFYPVSKQ